MKRFLLLLSVFCLGLSCTEEKIEEVPPLDSIDNPRANKLVSKYGETVSVSFQAADFWTAELVLATGSEWAEISQLKGNDAAGKGIVRIIFSENRGEERTAELYVSVGGNERILAATFVQAAGESMSELSDQLNKYMHSRLLEEYLWADEYSGLEVDMSVPYDVFLTTHLPKLKTNQEDGGYFRDNASAPGQRYIYSQISEVTSVKGMLPSTYGLGFGPFYASLAEAGKNEYILTVSYVYKDSPAAKAGMRRGDSIYAVDGARITATNYESLVLGLLNDPSESYKLDYLRFEPAEDRYELREYSAQVSPAEFLYDPVLHAEVIDLSPVKVGYLVLESFDSDSQSALTSCLDEFIAAGIDELVLDLRFNSGGEVQQSRYLASSIVGRKYDDRTFCDLQFNDGSIETWKFRSGPSGLDVLGQAQEISGLERLWLIMSERTASASELIINGLLGIGFPIILIGSRSEGKNVGMVISQTICQGRRFEFAPVTYRALNSKGVSGPDDGFFPTDGFEMNNQNTSTADDKDNMFPYSFGDWGNMDFNISLQYACAGIYGSASAQNVTYSCPFIPLSPLPEKERPLGRFGNAVYR